LYDGVVEKRVCIPMLLVSLDCRIAHLTTNQTLNIKDGVFRVVVKGVLSGVTDTDGTSTRLSPQPSNPTEKRLTVAPCQRRIPMKE